jgi:hypothetical protein
VTYTPPKIVSTESLVGNLGTNKPSEPDDTY